MGQKLEAVRERVDVVDETILLALREGPQSLNSLRVLAELNYHTCRQRLGKLLRYNYLAKPRYGEYALTEKGRQFVEQLTLPVTPDLKDPKLKKLIDLLPTELHRAFFRLVISGVIVKHHLFKIYDDGYPAFILGGETKGFKTALANVVCRVFGLKPEENIYALFSAIAGEFGVRRFRMKGPRFTIAASPYFRQPFVCLDEFDKVTSRDTKRNVLFFLDGRREFSVEGELVKNQVCTMVTLNTGIKKDGIERFGISEAYIRRSIVADTEHVRMELRNVDLVAKRIFEMKDFPRISLQRLTLAQTELADDVFRSLRNLLMDCTDEGFQGLVDTRPLVILTLGRSTLLGGDVREAMYQTLWDRLVCLESLGGTVAGWRKKVVREWARYKRQEQPEIDRQLREAEEREKVREEMFTERTVALEEKKVEQVDTEAAFILHRAELSSRIQGIIQKLGRGEPLAEPLRWLRGKVGASRTPEQLCRYEESFNKSMLPKAQLRLQENRALEERIRRENEQAKQAKQVEKDRERSRKVLEREQERKERIQRKGQITNLKSLLKQIGYYLRRKELKEGEDPVLTLQQLQIIKPVEGSVFLVVSDKLEKGHWLRDSWSGRLKYSAPYCDFIDYGAKIGWPSEVSGGRIYKWYEEVRSWTSWTYVWPLLQAKRTQILSEIAMLGRGYHWGR